MWRNVCKTYLHRVGFLHPTAVLLLFLLCWCAHVPDAAAGLLTGLLEARKTTAIPVTMRPMLCSHCSSCEAFGQTEDRKEGGFPNTSRFMQKQQPFCEKAWSLLLHRFLSSPGIKLKTRRIWASIFLLGHIYSTEPWRVFQTWSSETRTVLSLPAAAEISRPSRASVSSFSNSPPSSSGTRTSRQFSCKELKVLLLLPRPLLPFLSSTSSSSNSTMEKESLMASSSSLSCSSSSPDRVVSTDFTYDGKHPHVRFLRVFVYAQPLQGAASGVSHTILSSQRS